jgi:GH15 family glucan-1,4-alpha-glucosidase
MVYQPISNYGIIGNMHTTALIGLNGSIDWFCFPKHDSPSVFAEILDDEKGGYFRIYPLEQVLHSPDHFPPERVASKQFYAPGTNVLITRFLTSYGMGKVTDLMPVGLTETQLGYHSLIRQVRVERGALTFRAECYPAFNYARDSHQTFLTRTGACFQSSDLKLCLDSDIPLQQAENGIYAEFTLREGETATFIFQEAQSKEKAGSSFDQAQLKFAYDQTIQYWRRWLLQCKYKGRWREMVERSTLVLKLLTYEPTGAIIAAPTCGLPEEVGGERNWDYRYTWIRDAAFTLYGFLRLGFTQEAAQFMQWIESLCHDCTELGALQIVYGIDGRTELKEETLDHLKGYRNSYPVRLGNAAYQQLQLDIYGELMDAVYLYNKYGSPISYEFWNYLRGILNWVSENWQRKDQGMWEVRSEAQHFVYSKVMCWVALDRGIRLAEQRSLPMDHNRWLEVRDQIYEEIMTQGWDEELGTFVQYYGGQTIDASNLIMPLVFFLAPNDPRLLKMLKVVQRSPEAGGLSSGGLIHRYHTEHSEDGLNGEEGTFSMCTFWFIEALARAGRVDSQHLDEAYLLFEKTLSHANHLGLFAEEISINGQALGNFPQAFTHLALISAAWNLDKALG